MIALFIISIFFLADPSGAEAGLWSSIKSFTELPGEVKELKQHYEETQAQLEQANASLKEANDSLKETYSTLEQANASIEAYRLQNDRLMEQNRTLTAMVLELQQAEEVRKAYTKKTRTLLWTGFGLLAGYFVLLRMIRLAMRLRSR